MKEILVNALDRYTHKSTIKLIIADENESRTKLARTGSTWGIESGALNSEVCWKYICILALVLNL